MDSLVLCVVKSEWIYLTDSCNLFNTIAFKLYIVPLMLLNMWLYHSIHIKHILYASHTCMTLQQLSALFVLAKLGCSLTL